MKGLRQISFVGVAMCFSTAMTPCALAQPSKDLTSTQTKVTSALELAQSKLFDQAFAQLSDIPATEKDSYRYRFARARILTWSQRYEEAEREYEDLMRIYSDHPDLYVSYAFLELFRGNLDKAQSYFNIVIDHHPEYSDAHVGLERVNAMRKQL